MSYTIPDQSRFARNLQPHELVVQLDSGDLVAVIATCCVQPNTGNPVVEASARVVDADGNDKLDGAGQPIRSGFSHHGTPTEQEALGGADALKKQVVLAVLGEPTTIWDDGWHDTAMDHASIRTNIASAAHAGPVANLSEILGDASGAKAKRVKPSGRQ